MLKQNACRSTQMAFSVKLTRACSLLPLCHHCDTHFLAVEAVVEQSPHVAMP
jgi:hypothetical protein